MKFASVVPVCIALWVVCGAFLDFPRRMIPTFLLPLFDQNEDGILSHNELDIVRSHLPSFGFSNRESRILMTTADNNNDGALDVSEFNNLYQQIMAEQLRGIEERINS